MIETWLFRLVFLVMAGAFAVQVRTRYRLVMAGPHNFVLDDLASRVRQFVSEIVFQTKVIRATPWVGLAHLFVFWGFCAFGGYSLVELLHGLGLADLTETTVFLTYRMALVPFAVAVLVGIVFLLIRRGILRPRALGTTVSKESILIGVFIAILMVTFLLDLGLEPGFLARVNWWAHMLVVLTFLALIPNSKHLHLVVSPVTVFFTSRELGTVPNLDFEKDEVGFETVADLPAKQRLDAFTCVECGRCQENCPAFGTGKALNPKKLILQNEAALLAGKHDIRLVDLFDENVLWQCTTCGACERECPVGVEHLPLIIGARRGLVSNGEAPGYLGGVYNHLERRANIWGLTYDQRQKFLDAAGVETFDSARHEYLVWLGCAGAFEADYQGSLRALFNILRAKDVRFGALARERCTGDVAKRTGNEYLFQELASGNITDLHGAGARTIVTSCPHCLKTLGHDYRAFGFTATVLHSSVLVAELTRSDRAAGDQPVTLHDPCYLGRYAMTHQEPRDLLERFGARVEEPRRSRANPLCCGAGGGLLFEEHEPGKRISQERFEQLQATGAGTIVTACPFCSIMLKGAQTSANAAVELVDLMTFVDGRLQPMRGEASSRGTGAGV